MSEEIYTKFPKYSSYVEKHSVILDSANPEFPKIIGIIISQFAIIEDFVPLVVRQITGISEDDSTTILGVIRNFSNKIELIGELINKRDKKSNDFIVIDYVKNLLSEANSIRNKYAHAKYGGFKHNSNLKDEYIYMELFSASYNKNRILKKMMIKDFEKDRKRMNIMICEIHHILHARWLPPKLFAQLPQPPVPL